jgi:hypothetical protein
VELTSWSSGSTLIAVAVQVVRHCWHVVNDQDAVARAPKFLVLYKRTGQRVYINHTGDMIVRPSFIENSIMQLPGGAKCPCRPSSINLAMYCREVILAHFS